MPDRPSWPNWSSIGWVSTAFSSSVVVARSADIGVKDRHAIGGRPLRSLAIELVVEDGAHRPIGQRADLDRPRGGGFRLLPDKVVEKVRAIEHVTQVEPYLLAMS